MLYGRSALNVWEYDQMCSIVFINYLLNNLLTTGYLIKIGDFFEHNNKHHVRCVDCDMMQNINRKVVLTKVTQ